MRIEVADSNLVKMLLGSASTVFSGAVWGLAFWLSSVLPYPIGWVGELASLVGFVVSIPLVYRFSKRLNFSVRPEPKK